MNTFVALGGGNEIGASCYYLKLGDTNIMLDCGSRNGIKKYPYFDILIENRILRDKDDIDIISISHAHKDHYAALPTVANLKNSRIISTPKTKSKIIDMVDVLYKKKYFESEEEKFSFKHLVSTIFEFNYFEIIKCKDVEIMLVPAGHIDGASITIIFYEGMKIVYTGDFSLPLSDNQLYSELAMDIIMDCDLLIMENTNGDDFVSNKIMSKHINFNEMMDFLGIVHPKKLFLIHQNEENFYQYGFKEKINEYYPSIEIIKIKNKIVYDLGVLV